MIKMRRQTRSKAAATNPCSNAAASSTTRGSRKCATSTADLNDKQAKKKKMGEEDVQKVAKTKRGAKANR